MILGVGSDLVDVRRIERVIARHGDRFISRIFTETERAKAERRVTRIATYAKRFAAKEACAKALGTGFRAGVLQLRSVEYARNYGIPIHCRSSFDDGPGTFVLDEDQTMERPLVTAVTHSTAEARVTLTRCRTAAV